MEAYEAPEVVTYGELDFEPAHYCHDGTMEVCGFLVGHCSTSVLPW